jgi:hypothetical protein
MPRPSLIWTILPALGLLGPTVSQLRAAGPRILELYQQQAGTETYFLVRFQTPDDLCAFPVGGDLTGEARRFRLAWQARLLPAPGMRTLYPPVPVPAPGLWFAGRTATPDKVRVRLRYPVRQPERANDATAPHGAPGWREASFDLALAGAARQEKLTEIWHRALSGHYADLAARSDDGFFETAHILAARRVGVSAERPVSGDRPPPNLFDLFSGATSLTESLARQRLLGGRPEPPWRETIPISEIRGIDVAEHPWQKMLAGRKPDREPLAELIPEDHYYATFRTPRAAARLADLLDQWGGNLLRFLELHGRDHRIRARYERQLCLPMDRVVAALDPAWLHGLAVTGSDLALAEGSDVTVLFHLKDADKVLAALNGILDSCLADVRKEGDPELTEVELFLGGEKVLSWRNRLRTVCLYRAKAGDFLIYSNSRPALKKVLGLYHGKGLALADSLDFRYMRTIFRATDRDEAGFAFLSDAFIRQLVGPVHKIKAKRRLEARAGLELATHSALAMAVEQGRWPTDGTDLLTATGLTDDEIGLRYEGPPRWEGRQRRAVSDTYGTLHFSTPLLELGLQRITPGERGAYEMFRAEYLQLWRRFFDPVGLRLALSEDQVRLEAYILPVIARNGYAELRNMTGGGMLSLPVGWPAPGLARILLAGANNQFGAFLLDDSPALVERVRLAIRKEMAPGNKDVERQHERLFGQLGWTFRAHLAREHDVRWLTTILGDLLVYDQKPSPGWFSEFQIARKADRSEIPYRGSTIIRLIPRPERYRMLIGQLRTVLDQSEGGAGLLRTIFYYLPLEEPPDLYLAAVGQDFLLCFNEATMRAQIDGLLDREKAEKSAGQANAALHARLTPPHAAEAVRQYLEWETHRRALRHNDLWDVLYRSGAVRGDLPLAQREQAAYELLGYVPVSPDGSGYTYHAEAGEVLNDRHGSHRRPRLHQAPADGSPLTRLLEELTELRADLSFREDGIHTILTQRRK